MKTNIHKLKGSARYALFIFLIAALVEFAGCSNGTSKNAREDNITSTDKQQTKVEKNADNKKEDNKDQEKDEETSIKDNTDKTGYADENKIKFEKKELDKSVEPEFGTSWNDSTNKKLSVCIEGKGPKAYEEGIGKIYVKDLSKGDKWSLEISPNEESNSPKFIEWIDDESALVIIGPGYGTVGVGGNLYKLNVNTGAIEDVYVTESLKEQVVSVKKVDDKFEMQLLIYDDDDMIKSHTENKVIDLK